jgi:hypothetical protein
VKFDEDFGLQLPWGYKDKTFVLPKKESIDSDSSFWFRIADLLQVLGEPVEYTATNDATVPDISDSAVAHNHLFSFVFLRLVELAKSPSSATIRSGSLGINENIKNMVDFVYLDLIYKDKKNDYESLLLSSRSQDSRRKISIPRETKEGKKTVTVMSTSYTGYQLAELLSSYVEKRVAKSPEGEPFFRFIVEILNTIRRRVPEDYILPKSFFAPASAVLRSLLRKGPEKKSKKEGAARAVTYIPFSFAKSSECNAMQETTKKTLTETGSSISKEIDSINNLPLMEQVRFLPTISELVKVVYSISDQLRKEWQLKGRIVSEVETLKKIQNIDFYHSVNENIETLKKLSSWKPVMVTNYSNNADQTDLVNKLEKIREQREEKRRKTS